MTRHLYLFLCTAKTTRVLTETHLGENALEILEAVTEDPSQQVIEPQNLSSKNIIKMSEVHQTYIDKILETDRYKKVIVKSSSLGVLFSFS